MTTARPSQNLADKPLPTSELITNEQRISELERRMAAMEELVNLLS